MDNVENRHEGKGPVTLFIPNLAGGGAERAMVNLAKGLDRAGVEVDLLVASATGAYASAIPDGVRLVDMGRKRVVSCLPDVVLYLRRRRPVAVVSALPAPNVVAVLARAIAGTPTRVVTSIHSTLSENTDYASSPMVALYTKMVGLAYRWSDNVACVSEGVARDAGRVLGMDPDRFVVTYNPVVDDELTTLAKAPVEGLGDGGDAAVLVAVGRLGPTKGFDTLIDAVALLRERRPAHLYVAGEGPSRGELEAQALRLGVAGAVSFLGFVNNPYALVARASAFVMASRYEGLSNVLIEAMAVGTPVVATDCPHGPREILEGGRHGPLVPVGDAQALARAIERVLDAPPSAATLKARAADFSVDAVTQRYVDVLFG